MTTVSPFRRFLIGVTVYLAFSPIIFGIIVYAGLRESMTLIFVVYAIGFLVGGTSEAVKAIYQEIYS